MTDRTNRKEIEQSAMVDYLQVAGKVVLASEVECYDASGSSVTVHCDPPAVVRIFQYDTAQIFRDALRWSDERHLDPYYDIGLLEPHPAFEGVRPSWMYGTCRCLDGTVDRARFVVADDAMQERYRDAPGLSDADAAGPAAPGPRP
jgi:hypothetical protein